MVYLIFRNSGDMSLFVHKCFESKEQAKNYTTNLLSINSNYSIGIEYWVDHVYIHAGLDELGNIIYGKHICGYALFDTLSINDSITLEIEDVFHNQCRNIIGDYIIYQRDNKIKDIFQ